MFAYLQDNHNAEFVFDPTEYSILGKGFEGEDSTNTVYGNCTKSIPTNAPKTIGLGFKIVSYVDLDHSGDNVTRRSCTRFIVYLNSAPIYWMFKRQVSIKTSLFASEFYAMKVCCEYIQGLQYKL